MISTIAKPFTQVNDERGSGHIQATCAQCRHYDRGVCKLKAQADWGNSSKVSPTRKACFLAELLPF
ncbi:MAG: hypothetical protein KME43_11395 [Myxacorys chilensis ATA2-1-KO14]|jgi:hypothetical protein|nr:hypothetical protein [Myxacorys chilensis ATA2-1-KO14]